METNSDSVCLINLPLEIIEVILSSESISFQDLCHVTCVCCKFRDVIRNSNLWKIKFQQRWPELFKHYTGNSPYNWNEECRHRLQSAKAIRKKISEMSSIYYKDDEVSCEAFADFEVMMENHCHGYHVVIDELLEILSSGDQNENLTVKYYTQKAIRFIQHVQLREKWQQFLLSDEESQSLEMGAILLAQWCQPNAEISTSKITSELDKLACLVREEIQIRHPNHPVVKSKNVQCTVKLKESLWTPGQCRVILDCMNTVMFEQLGFKGNQQSYYEADNSYINKILETKMGIPIALCIAYASIAQRLGVICEPVNFPAHFLLRWKEHPSLSNGQEYTYIDVFNKGKFMPEKECVTILPPPFVVGQSIYEAVPPIRVFQRMAHNLVEVGRQQNNTNECLMCLRNALELLLLLQPDDTDSRLLLARVYLHLNIDLPQVISSLQHIQETDPTRAGIVAYMFQICQNKMETKKTKCLKKWTQSRDINSDVEFTTGLIMVHKRYNYKCVIYGWDPQCTADNEWIIQMGVNNLSKKRFQPFYHVLVEDGSNRYAAQENLILAEEPTPIRHPEIGRYFTKFCNCYYVPNEEKRAEYPEDEAFRVDLLKKHFHHSSS